MHSSSMSATAPASISPSAHRSPEPSSCPNVLACLPSTSILLVEDEPAVSAFLECALEHFGFQVTACSNVGAAMQSFKEQIPTLILTDCNLPQGSGIELIKAVIAKCSTMPIIGMSAQHYNGVAMIESGAIAFIPKPIEMDTLKRTVVQIAECGMASAMTNVNARL